MKIWLVWATNVWKSTLFNRLIWQFRAIVTDIAWTTVDILEHTANINEIWNVILSDSPWLSTFEEERTFIKKIISESDIILFVIDDTVWITAKEEQIFSFILEKNKKNHTILVVNKLDKKRKVNEYDIAISDYYHLWFETIIWISAEKQNYLEKLQKAILQKSKTIKIKNNKVEVKNNDDYIHIAIVGKPNAGKSTLLNTITWQQIAKTEDTAWTTRDYLTWEFAHQWQKYKIYDTAWIKKKWQMQELEKIAYDKTQKMLEYIRPLVIFMIDWSLWVSHRDLSLIAEINILKLPLIISINKMDLLSEKEQKEAVKQLEKHLDFAKYIPIIPTTAINWDWINKIFRMIKSVRKESHKRIETHDLNEAVNKDRITRPPRFPKNKICKILYATQVEIHAPRFIFFINYKKRANFAFKKWIENTIRKNFWFVGTPISITFKEREQKKHSEHKEKNTSYRKSYE